MNIDLALTPAPRSGDLAVITLTADQLEPMVVRLDTHKMRRYGVTQTPVAVDLVLLAVTVYAIDCLVPRETTQDVWTRDLAFEMPVADPALWTAARPNLERCLSFLSGDRWTVTFSQRDVDVWQPRRTAPVPTPVQAVSLFSGGLDSAIGVINRLAGTTDKLLLVGHSDSQTSGTKKDQREVYGPIEAAHPGRSELLQIHAGFDRGADERTMRSRSFMFLALGVWAANVHGPTVPLLIPENGTIALNMPLTPTRTGSSSTRTTHPHYLDLYRALLQRLGLHTPLDNPLADQTKGETIRHCLNQSLLQQVDALTNSCAKSQRKGRWIRRTPQIKHCGQCMPCLYRRAALHGVGRDDGQQYGFDLLKDEVNLDGNSPGANDARALLYLVRSQATLDELEDRLFINGRLDVTQRQLYAQLVDRTIAEVRDWVRQGGSPTVRARAGV